MTMTPEERAKYLTDYLFRLGKHSDVKVEFHPVEYVAAAIRAAEQEARAAADAEWAAKLGKALADGETEAEQRGAERTRDNLYDVLRDQWGFSIGNAERLIKALIDRAKQTEPA